MTAYQFRLYCEMRDYYIARTGIPKDADIPNIEALLETIAFGIAMRDGEPLR